MFRFAVIIFYNLSHRESHARGSEKKKRTRANEDLFIEEAALIMSADKPSLTFNRVILNLLAVQLGYLFPSDGF